MLRYAGAPVRRPWILIIIMSMTAVGLTAGGIRLISLGGSPYYLLSGLTLLACAVTLWLGDRRTLWIYAAYMAATIVWALCEAGLNGWALAPRLMYLSGFGVWLAFPRVRCWLGDAVVSGNSLSRWFALVPVAAVVATITLAAAWPAGGTAQPAFPDIAGNRATAENLIGPANGEWPEWGNTLAGTRFSPLELINRNNVADLKLAWSYRTGVVQPGETSGMETTPLMVNGTLYLCTQTNVVIALDPETGAERWRFDPKVDATSASLVRTCRGVAYAAVGGSADCPKRIITGTFDVRLVAVNADTGRPCASFGTDGTVDLKSGMGGVDPGFYYTSSAPTIVGSRIILGGWVADNVKVGEPSGVIRAYDVGSGKFAWAWDLGRPGWHDEPVSGDSYTRGTPNSWAPMSGDEKLGLVYVPTGNATPDHWGGHRSAYSDQFSTSLVALDAATGELRWSFQGVHHDIWDYDMASQPTLVDVTINGQIVPAVVQPTKSGQIFMLDRRDGRLLANIEERPVSHDAAPGDHLAATQPFSTGLPSFEGPPLRERNMWGLTPFDQLWCRIKFRSLRYDGMFTPIKPDATTLIYPGIGGGMNWGGVSVDPERGIMLVNSLNIGTMARLLPRAEADALGRKNPGKKTFHNLNAPMLMAGTPFAVAMGTFVSPLGVPCNEPPYGVMSAVDLNTRKLLWSVPLGETTDSGPLGVRFGIPITMGVPNFGGSVTTRAGLVFIAATHERAIRAFDIRSGAVLWKARLPAAGQTVPMTYISPASGRQFILTIAGGHRTLQAPLGDYVEAFALPRISTH
jgi:membrane-bound PQQ-dependent dehydrogenase (glucose/quinate/shikimate family)